MIFWWFLLLTSVVSWALTGFLRRYALAKNLIDIPNERSSHSVPTPRGGGVAIVVSFLAVLPLLNCLICFLLPCFWLYGAPDLPLR